MSSKPKNAPAFVARTRALASKSGATSPQVQGGTAPVDLLAQVPEEEVWLAGLKSERTRHAYRLDVRDFIETLELTSSDELYRVSRAAVIAWRTQLEARGLQASTIRRKLSALSSLFKHLVAHHLAEANPVREVPRPDIERKRGSTAAFSRDQARAILDAPPLTRTRVQNGESEDVPLTGAALLRSLRDRAILSVGFQVGPRRHEIAHLTVGSLHMHKGMAHLTYVHKGGKKRRVPINAQTERRILAYLEAAGHGDDFDGPLFRPTRRNQVEHTDDMRRHLLPLRIDQILRHWCAKALGITRGFSAHSMRATFATIADANGAAVEDIQEALGHAHISTTELYIHRGDDPESAATHFATY